MKNPPPPPSLQSLQSGQCCVGHIDLTVRLIDMLIRGYSHRHGFYYNGKLDSHVPVLGLVFSTYLYFQLVTNASCISCCRACNDLMAEHFRVSTNSVRVLRQLTMGRVLINLRWTDSTKLFKYGGKDSPKQSLHIFIRLHVFSDWLDN